VRHAVPTVVYTPNAHSLCGEFRYSPLYQGVPISGTDPVNSYDDGTQTFAFYSTDFSLIGLTKQYGVVA